VKHVLSIINYSMGKDYMKFIKTIGSTMYFLASGRYDAKKGGYVLDKNSSQQLIVEKDQLTGRVMDMKMPIRGLSVYESIDVFSKHVSGQAKASTSVARKPVTTPTSNVDILGKIAREEARLAGLEKGGWSSNYGYFHGSCSDGYPFSEEGGSGRSRTVSREGSREVV
jgi:hypothetical protein